MHPVDNFETPLSKNISNTLLDENDKNPDVQQGMFLVLLPLDIANDHLNEVREKCQQRLSHAREMYEKHLGKYG